MEQILRRYEHMAQKEHWCDRCFNYIQPGEMYEGMVMTKEPRGIITFKYHVYPSCEFPKEPKYEESDLEQIVKDEVKKAA